VKSAAGKAVLAFAAILGVPSLAIVSLWQAAPRSPIGTIAITASYEVFLGVGVVASKIFSGPLNRRTEQVGALVDRAIGQRISRYKRYYRNYVADELQFTDVKGQPTGGPFTPELNDVYVDLSLVPKSAFQISGAVLVDTPLDITVRYSRSIS
jgi:hypothetical protein